MTIDIRTLRIQEKIISALCDIRLKRSDVAYLVNILSSAKDELSGYCDNSFPYEKKLCSVVANMCEHLSEEIYIFSYGKGDDNFTTTGLPSKINEELLQIFGKDLSDLEKLIIRGSEEGAPVTEEERQEWWKKQKEREREEFYKMNGYYEDEE